ncbi:MAG: hypothetical protein WDO24_21525 [Pseudomonadota bacterium]
MTTQTMTRGIGNRRGAGLTDVRSHISERLQFAAAYGLFTAGLINIGYLCAVLWV